MNSKEMPGLGLQEAGLPARRNVRYVGNWPKLSWHTEFLQDRNLKKEHLNDMMDQRGTLTMFSGSMRARPLGITSLARTASAQAAQSLCELHGAKMQWTSMATSTANGKSRESASHKFVR